MKKQRCAWCRWNWTDRLTTFIAFVKPGTPLCDSCLEKLIAPARVA